MAETFNNESSTISSPEIINGNLNAFGMEISISSIIGDKIIDRWFSQLTQEDMDLIFKAVNDEIFSHNYNDVKFFKTTITSKNYYGSTTYEDTPIWKSTKSLFAKKYNELILSKVDDIIASDEYQQKAEQIAKDIVEYATNGYKTDMINRVKERLVCNTLDSYPSYDNIDLRTIIRQTVNDMIHNNGNTMNY